LLSQLVHFTNFDLNLTIDRIVPATDNVIGMDYNLLTINNIQEHFVPAARPERNVENEAHYLHLKDFVTTAENFFIPIMPNCILPTAHCLCHLPTAHRLSPYRRCASTSPAGVAAQNVPLSGYLRIGMKFLFSKDRTGNRIRQAGVEKKTLKIPYVFPVFYISFLLGLARMTG
jgi:hypothetical protein